MDRRQWAMPADKPRVLHEEKQNILVFGYNCKLFRDDDRAQSLEEGTHLIPWMGDGDLLIDRYDGRGHLHDLDPYDSDKIRIHHQLTAEEQRIERLCDEERYMGLSEDLEERAIQEEEEIKRLNQELAVGGSKYGAINFSYGGGEQSQPSKPEPKPPPPKQEAAVQEDDEEPYVPSSSLRVPPSMAIPATVKLNSIIEKTAAFVGQHGGQMEIMIKTKQANNAQFLFLNFEHHLNVYYKHVLRMIKSGMYKPQPPKQRKPSGGEGSEYLHPTLNNNSNEPTRFNAQTVPQYTASQLENTAYGKLMKKIAPAAVVHPSRRQGSAPGSPASQSAPHSPARSVYTPPLSHREARDTTAKGASQARDPAGSRPRKGQKLTAGPAAAKKSEEYNVDSPCSATGSESGRRVASPYDVPGPPPPPPSAGPSSACTDAPAQPASAGTLDWYRAGGTDVSVAPPPPPADPTDTTDPGAGWEASSGALQPPVDEYGEMLQMCGEWVSRPPRDTKAVMDRMATYVHRGGQAFEEKVRGQNDSRFEFLDPQHPHHRYYQLAIAQLSQPEQTLEAGSTGVGAPEETDEGSQSGLPAKLRFSIKQRDPESSPLDKTVLPVDESSEDEEGNSVKKAESEQPPAKVPAEEKPVYVLPEEEETALKKKAEQRLKDRLAVAARGKLAQATKENKEKMLQAERKKRAAAFVNMIKRDSAAEASAPAAPSAAPVGPSESSTEILASKPSPSSTSPSASPMDMLGPLPSPNHSSMVHASVDVSSDRSSHHTAASTRSRRHHKSAKDKRFRRSRSPAKKRSRSPSYNKSRSPHNKRSKSPSYKRSRSSSKRRSRSPRSKRPKSPLGKRSRSPSTSHHHSHRQRRSPVVYYKRQRSKSPALPFSSGRHTSRQPSQGHSHTKARSPFSQHGGEISSDRWPSHSRPVSMNSVDRLATKLKPASSSKSSSAQAHRSHSYTDKSQQPAAPSEEKTAAVASENLLLKVRQRLKADREALFKQDVG